MEIEGNSTLTDEGDPIAVVAQDEGLNDVSSFSSCDAETFKGEIALLRWPRAHCFFESIDDICFYKIA